MSPFSSYTGGSPIPESLYNTCNVSGWVEGIRDSVRGTGVELSTMPCAFNQGVGLWAGRVI